MALRFQTELPGLALRKTLFEFALVEKSRVDSAFISPNSAFIILACTRTCENQIGLGARHHHGPLCHVVVL